MLSALALWLGTAIPTVRVDGRELAEQAGGRAALGHVIERLLEAGVGVDPAASTRVILTPAGLGYRVRIEAVDGLLADVTIEPGDRAAAVVELELVQVAVDLARDHAVEMELGADAIAVASTGGAARIELITALVDDGATLRPAGAVGVPAMCVEARDDGVAAASDPGAAGCFDALAGAQVHATIDEAIAAARAPEPALEAVVEPAPKPIAEQIAKPVATPSPARKPWGLGVRIGLGFAWRPRAFDAAPSLGFEAVHPRGLVLGFDATLLPSRTPSVVAVDTQLAAVLGYRFALPRRVALVVAAAAGTSIHAAHVGNDRDVRADPLLSVPIQIEGAVARSVALGLRFAVATTLRTRVHDINGFEVWRRGPVIVLVAVTARFGR